MPAGCSAKRSRRSLPPFQPHHRPPHRPPRPVSWRPPAHSAALRHRGRQPDPGRGTGRPVGALAQSCRAPGRTSGRRRRPGRLLPRARLVRARADPAAGRQRRHLAHPHHRRPVRPAPHGDRAGPARRRGRHRARGGPAPAARATLFAGCAGTRPAVGQRSARRQRGRCVASRRGPRHQRSDAAHHRRAPLCRPGGREQCRQPLHRRGPRPAPSSP